MVIDLARAKARLEMRTHLLAAGAEALARGDSDLHEMIASVLIILEKEDITAPPSADRAPRA